MMTSDSNKANKGIARNTLFLYIRKILTLVIGLYTSRVLLQTLGVDDFGLYGLIGSIVVLFNSLRSLFASSIQRFLNIQKSGTIEIQNKIFSMGISIHIGIAILFFLIVEIAGFIMIPNLNLMPEKTSVAYWVLQFSILSAVVSILTVPYDALMMAKERFDAMAGFALLDSFLRLGVIFLLVLSPINRVITYSILLLVVGLTIRMLSALYCKRQFRNIAKYKLNKDRALFREMTYFAGWNFLGNLGYSLTNEGLNFVLNLFGGVVANAARTITNQVNNQMRSFVVDIALAFMPQSMMSYNENKSRFYNLQFFSSKASSAVFLIFVFPIYLMTGPILTVWLGECPLYTVSFIHGIIFYSIVRNWHGPVDIAFKSANRMKVYQIVEISIMLLNIPISWLLLHFGAPLYTVFIVMAVVETINLIVILLIAKIQIEFPVANFVGRVVFPTIISIVIFAIGYLGYNYFQLNPDNIVKLLSYCIVCALIAALITSMVIFDSNERKRVFELLKKK